MSGAGRWQAIGASDDLSAVNALSGAWSANGVTAGAAWVEDVETAPATTLVTPVTTSTAKTSTSVLPTHSFLPSQWFLSFGQTTCSSRNTTQAQPPAQRASTACGVGRPLTDSGPEPIPGRCGLVSIAYVCRPMGRRMFPRTEPSLGRSSTRCTRPPCSLPTATRCRSSFA